MNIFALSECPIEAAQMNIDKHIVKISLEVCQQLVAATYNNGATEKEIPLTKGGTPYRPTHQNHPVTLWVGKTRSNFEWAAMHGEALCEEYTYRYGKIHACQKPIQQLSKMIDLIPAGPLIPFFTAMPDEFKVSDPVQSYRNFYLHGKRKVMECKWTKRQPPEWWIF